MAKTKIRGNTQILDGTITNDQLSSSAGIETSKLADGASFLKSDGTIAMNADLDMNSNRISNVAAPVNPTDVARKQDVDNAVLGLSVKEAVRVASTANVDIAGELEDGDILDGVTLATGDRVLLKDQTVGSENGIYEVVASGAASRSSDADTSGELSTNLFLFVSEGTTNADTGWVLTNDGAITLDTTALLFTQFSGAGVGDVSAGANVGTAGVGVFKQLSGSTLQFYKINSGDSKISVALDAVNDEIDLAIAAGSLVDADISASAMITRNKLANGSANHVLINDGSGVITSEEFLAVTRGGTGSSAALVNDRIIVSNGGAMVELDAITANRALISDANGLPTASVVTDAELAHLSGVTSGIQAQIDAKLGSNSLVVRETPAGTIDGVNKIFTLANTPVAGSESAYLNGLIQDEGASDDYTISGDTITFDVAPEVGDKLLCSYLK